MKFRTGVLLGIGMCLMIVTGTGLVLAASGTGKISVTFNGTITINSVGIGYNTSSGVTVRSSTPYGSTSTTNTPITVNNSASTPFLVWVNITDTSGYKAIQYVNVYMYYLNGASSNGYNSTHGANMNIYLNLTNTTLTGTAAHTEHMYWPSLSQSPTAWLVPAGGYYKYVSTTTANFTFELYLGSQIHNGTGPSSTQSTKWAWALNTTAKGDGASANSATVYFGVNDYEAISIAQDTLSGSGAPSSTALYALGSFELHYSINNNYTLTLESSNLTATIGTNTYTFYRQNIGVYYDGTGTYNGSAAPNAYYTSSLPATAGALPSGIGTSAGEARPFNDTTGPSVGQVSIFGYANVSYALAQQEGVWEFVTVDFVFQVPIGTVSATYTGLVTYRLWAQNQAFP